VLKCGLAPNASLIFMPRSILTCCLRNGIKRSLAKLKNQTGLV
jgi:hypothetical protein